MLVLRQILAIMVVAFLPTISARADVFLFENSSAEQLPNSGDILHDALDTGSGPGFDCSSRNICATFVSPIDSSFSISAFNYVGWIEDTTASTVEDSAFFVVSDRSETPAGKVYLLGFIENPGCQVDICVPTIVTNGDLTPFPFSITWSNSTRSYTDTFEFEFGDSNPVITPEPQTIGVLLFGLGLVVVSRKKVLEAER